jgi:two-component system, NtrC family, sensor kinase
MDKINPSETPKSLNDLGHLSSAVGHNVINAFSAIVSNAEILRIRMAMPAPVDPTILADLIITTAMEAASVARRLIDYTRPITSIGDDRLDLASLVAEFVEARRRGGSDGVTWSTDLSTVPPIRGQADQLRAMLERIVANSLEAKAGPSIEIAFSTMLDSRGWVVLEIRDSGRGMEPQVMDRAVEPFFSTKPGHIGVGLSIANGIWRRHKGTLSLRSMPGDGTVLRLCVDPSAP